MGGSDSPGEDLRRTTVFRKSYPVATIIVGMERKKENSRAVGLDIPANSPAVIVDIERDVPGKIAERICAAPMKTAWSNVMSSMRAVPGVAMEGRRYGRTPAWPVGDAPASVAGAAEVSALDISPGCPRS